MSKDVRVAENPTTLVDETLRVSRLLGEDPFLVLVGGGNTSAKADDRLWAKASGFDLGCLTPQGLVEVDRRKLDALLDRTTLSDLDMVAGYQDALIDPSDASPTIEALLHHALPHASVLHTHADAIVTLTDTVRGTDLVSDALGEDVIVLPYIMPGFDLAKIGSAAWHEHAGRDVRAIVLAHHGLFTMGDTPQEAYDRHVDLVTRAEKYVERHTGIDLRAPLVPATSSSPSALAALQEELTDHATGPVAVLAHRDAEIDTFLAREDLEELTQRGPTTLEHVIRTKRVPMVDGTVANYVAEYAEYFRRHRDRGGQELQMLDPVPRVILDREHGLVTTGTDERAAQAAQDIYRHSIRVMTAAESLGGYRTMTEAQAFDIEYWELEQRRLRA